MGNKLRELAATVFGGAIIFLVFGGALVWFDVNTGNNRFLGNIKDLASQAFTYLGHAKNKILELATHKHTDLVSVSQYLVSSETMLNITVRADELTVNDIKLNRGNCKLVESDSDHLFPTHNLHFGDKKSVFALCSSVIEAVIETDKGDNTFTWGEATLSQRQDELRRQEEQESEISSARARESRDRQIDEMHRINRETNSKLCAQGNTSACGQ